MDTETPQKPRRGAWHQQARELRAAGLTYDEIGHRLGVSGVAVYFAIHPEKRWKGKKKTGAEAPANPPSE
jgi:orotate phosphoribosyltransferase-like protein